MMKRLDVLGIKVRLRNELNNLRTISEQPNFNQLREAFVVRESYSISRENFIG